MKTYIGEVELIKPPKLITEQSIADYIAKCAGVVRDKEPKDNVKLLYRLMKEAYGNKPSRVLECIPCKIRADYEYVHSYNTQIFGFFVEDLEYEDPMYYTNARELLNWGYGFEEVLRRTDFTHYRTISCVAPYFVYGQVSTHAQITSVSHSQRFAKCDRGYWYPKEYEAYFKGHKLKAYDNPQEEWNNTIPKLAPLVLENFMKKYLGIKRREVWARGADMLQYRPFTLGGYINNPNAWNWFMDQRAKDNHVQQETRDFVKMIEKIIK